MTNEPISIFSGEYAFLSNFYPHAIEVDHDIYPTNKHAFQALKTDDDAERKKVREAKTPASAKSLGKRVTLRENWDMLRFEVMERLVRIKFSDPDLAAQLLSTGTRELIEGNTWRDAVWGCIMLGLHHDKRWALARAERAGENLDAGARRIDNNEVV